MRITGVSMRPRFILIIGLLAAAIVGGQLFRRQRDLTRSPTGSHTDRERPRRRKLSQFLANLDLIANVKTDLGATPAGDGPDGGIESRDPSEWQGMMVERDMLQAECDGPQSCGMAMACKRHRCLPCQEDGDCAVGESCAVQHCVLTKRAGCRSRRDCLNLEELCVLSGYSSDPRGNSEMTASCIGSTGGTSRAQGDAAYRSTQLRPRGAAPIVQQGEDLRDGL